MFTCVTKHGHYCVLQVECYSADIIEDTRQQSLQLMKEADTQHRQAEARHAVLTHALTIAQQAVAAAGGAVAAADAVAGSRRSCE